MLELSITNMKLFDIKFSICILYFFSFFCAISLNAQQKGNNLFVVKDMDIEIERGLIIKNANLNYNNYIESTGWGKKKRKAFAEAYNIMITAIYNGDISERNESRRYVDKKGIIKNSYKKFDAYGAVAYFLDTIIDGLSWRVYEKQCRIKEENKQKEKMKDITRIIRK